MQTIVAVATDNRQANRHRPKAPTKSPQIIYFSFVLIPRGVPRIPQPLCGRLFTRKGSADAPAGIGNERVQMHARTADKQTIGAAATDNRIIHLAGIIPTTITGVRCFGS